MSDITEVMKVTTDLQIYLEGLHPAHKIGKPIVRIIEEDKESYSKYIFGEVILFETTNYIGEQELKHLTYDKDGYAKETIVNYDKFMFWYENRRLLDFFTK